MGNRRLSTVTAMLLVTLLCWDLVAVAATPTSATAAAIAPNAPANGSFVDLDEHWAKKSILWLAERGLVNGSAEGSGRLLVRPDTPITRAEMTKVIIGMLSIEPVAGPSPAFKDTAGHWSNGYLAAAKEAGITQGYPDGTFNPDGMIDRAEMAALAARAFKAPEGAGTPEFRDVPVSHWAHGVIRAASGMGWIKGYADGVFQPASKATRAEAFTVLARVDEQQALINTARGAARTKGGLSAKGHLQQGAAFLEELGAQVPSSHLKALQSDLGASWPNGSRIPAENVLEHEAATARDLSERWSNGALRSPPAVGAFAHLLMSARQGAEAAVADANLVFGVNADLPAQSPSGVNRLDWGVAAQFASVARDHLKKANAALEAGDGPGAVDAFRSAWGASTRALITTGVNMTADSHTDVDGDGIPDRLELRFGSSPFLIDTDGDGLTDEFEITYGGNLFEPGRRDTNGDGVPDGEEDADGDGLSNAEEQKRKTNPLNEDTDHDGVPDGREISLGTDPLVVDSDGDGVADGAELRLGTNPTRKDAGRTVTTRVDSSAGSVSISGPASSLATVQVRVGDQSRFSRTPGLIGNAVTFTASGPFKTATVELPVSVANVPKSDINALRVFYFDEQLQAWLPVEGKQQYDPATGRIHAETKHFTTFAVFHTPDWDQAWSATQCAPRTQAEAPKAVDLALALDSAGSMEDNDPQNLRKQAGIRMVMSLLEGDRVAVIDFDSEAVVLQELTNHLDAATQAILRVDSAGGTAVDAGIRASLSALGQPKLGRARVIVLLTDGRNDGAAFDPAVIEEAVRQDTTIFTVGLGQSVDTDLLQQIAARTGGRYLKVQKADDLPKAFIRINETIGTNDFDQDGLSDCEEIHGLPDQNGRLWYSNPLASDSDGDGLTDRQEMNQQVQPDLVAGHKYPKPYWLVSSDPMKRDSDDDGLDDAVELKLGTLPLSQDTDGDNLSDGDEVKRGTNPLNPNTDGDDMNDGDEVSFGRDPLNPNDGLTINEWLQHFYLGVKLGVDCEPLCKATAPFYFGQVVNQAVDVMPVTQLAQELITGAPSVAWALLHEQIGEKEKRWLVHVTAIGTMVGPVTPLKLICPPRLRWNVRLACAEAFTQGLLDGFVTMLQQEWDGIAGIPQTIGVVLRFASDSRFRTEVLAHAGEMATAVGDLIKRLPGEWREYAQLTLDSLSQRVQQLSGLKPGDPGFEYWLTMYPFGWTTGMAAEIAQVTLVTAGTGKAIMSVPQIEHLLQTVRFIVRNLTRLDVASLRSLFVLDRLFPEREIFVVIESITDRRTRSYLEKAVATALNTASQLKDDAQKAHLGRAAELAEALRKIDASLPEFGAVLESASKLKNAGIRSYMDERLSQTLETARHLEGEQLRTQLGRAEKLAEALQKVERGAPEFGHVLVAAKNAKLRQYLEDAVSEGMALADSGPKEQLMMQQLREVAVAVRTPPVEDEVYNGARKVWEGRFTPEEAEMLRMMQPDHVADPALRAVIKGIRDAIPGLAEGDVLRKALTSEALEILVNGRLPDGTLIPKNGIVGYITRTRYSKDARSVRELVETLRLDYENGIPLDATEIHYVDFRYTATENGLPRTEIPRSKAVDGSFDCTQGRYKWPFACTGWLSSTNGRWVPEWRFTDGGQRLQPGTTIYKAWMEVVEGRRVMKQKAVFAWDGISWVSVP